MLLLKLFVSILTMLPKKKNKSPTHTIKTYFFSKIRDWDTLHYMVFFKSSSRPSMIVDTDSRNAVLLIPGSSASFAS